MNTSSSLGPDGFGPSFYRTFWSLLKNDVLELFAAFMVASLDLDRLNQAYLVLIPKKDGARTLEAFRPISLQGCLVTSPKQWSIDCSALRTWLVQIRLVSSRGRASLRITSTQPNCLAAATHGRAELRSSSSISGKRSTLSRGALWMCSCRLEALMTDGDLG